MVQFARFQILKGCWTLDAQQGPYSQAQFPVVLFNNLDPRHIAPCHLVTLPFMFPFYQSIQDPTKTAKTLQDKRPCSSLTSFPRFSAK